MPGFKSLLSFIATLSAVHAFTLTEKRATDGYVQSPSGAASFTMYSGCGSPACGVAATGFTAAMNQLAFGSGPGVGPGDACGRCFALTGEQDPYSPAYTGPFGKTVVVKVTDLCPAQGNEVWCGQTDSQPLNQYQQPFHFDLCEDTGAAAEFFPSGHGALTGTFTEVSCSEWSGSDGSPLWNGACIAGESAPLWPSVGCGNQGTAPGAPSGPASTISSAPASTPSSSAPPTSPTSTAPGALQTQYGQCGGTGYTGPTTCASPFVCTPVSPPYYSQCQ